MPKWFAPPPATHGNIVQIGFELQSAAHGFPRVQDHCLYREFQEASIPSLIIFDHEIADESGLFKPSRGRKLFRGGPFPAAVSLSSDGSEDERITTFLHEVGHCVDREMVGRGFDYASVTRMPHISARTVREIMAIVTGSREFLNWVERTRAVKKLLLGWSLSWGWRAAPEHAVTEVTHLRLKLRYYSYFSDPCEWFANLYADKIVTKAHEAGRLTDFQAQGYWDQITLDEHQLSKAFGMSLADARVRLQNSTEKAEVDRLFERLLHEMTSG